MKVGDERIELPTVDSELMLRDRQPRKCVVVFIHPQYRFYVVEFTTERDYRFRETFYFEDRDPSGPPLPEPLRGRIARTGPRDSGRFGTLTATAVWRPMYS